LYYLARGEPVSGPPRLDVYCIAIGGSGMAPLACLLQGRGHRVRGADGPLYPPMSTLLEAAGIRPATGFDPAHLDPEPDLVVVGNAVPRHNPEAVEVERRGLARLSMPEALARFFLADRRPLVVAGTHGKTTTTALAAWVYTACGADPGYLIGGLPRGLPGSFHDGSGERFVIEGDEYNASYFDRGPKFLHYRPETLILTSVEYDHADLYPDHGALLEAYGRLLELLPESGLAVVCGDSPEARALAGRARCRTLYYGLDPGSNELAPLAPPEPLAGAPGNAGGSRFRVADPEAGEVEITVPLAGDHNVANALAVGAVARHDGLPAAGVARAIAGFGGVSRRQEELGTAAGVTVVDDFAHHPTAVAATLAALGRRYPGRRLVAVFEPRSLTAGRAMFFDAYLDAFALAGVALFGPAFHAGRLAPEERLDFPALAAALGRRGTAAAQAGSNDALAEEVLAAVRPGDVVVTMSSGSFDGMPRRLLAALAGGRPDPR
jgi:UDP-N-acetylmuramate: L-alanyl-gamma-D-glutamyl-meso-diaminopimelate ligase